MREFKFRAWHSGNENVQPCMLFEERPGECFKWLGEHQPVIIMQYTGLKDSSGKEIYEGDVVVLRIGDWESVRGVVAFGAFRAELYVCCGWYVAGKDGGQVSEAGLRGGFEIIGNVHENPELLGAAR